MHDTHNGMLFFLYCFSFFTTSLTSALLLLDGHPLQLPPASTTATTNNNNNTPPLLSTPPNPSCPSSPLPLLSPSTPPLPLPSPAAHLQDHLSYVCNGPALGYGLSLPSCTDAVRFVGINTSSLSWGMRHTHTGPAPFDRPLPQRFVSSDGLCALEPSVASGVPVARASLEDVAVAAFVVVRNCVGGEGGRGGVARDIGGDNNLRVYVSKNDASAVRCYGKMHRPDAQLSCQQILNDMTTSELNEYFGPRGDPLVNVGVPFLLLSDDHKCKITIRTTGKGAGRTDLWSWGQFWENAVSLAGMCVREGKEGVQTGLGEKGYLYMEIGGPQSGAALEGNLTEI